MASSGVGKVAILSGLGLVMLSLSGVFLFHKDGPKDGGIGMAVEFMDHAAAAYVAQDKGWFRARGLNLSAYTSYVTGMALASALARKDIQVAYMCLVPAIHAYANAKVPIKIVSGTHKYGYALVADPAVVAGPDDLARENVRIGCVREGGAVDFLLHRTLDKYGLDRQTIPGRVRRMNPPKLLIAIKTGRLDAAFLPEQWASMAEDLGFQMLLSAREVWPGMQGSVLVVKEELIRESPDLVRDLVEVNAEATRWILGHPGEASRTLARVLSVEGGAFVPAGVATLSDQLEMNAETMLRSMQRLEYATAISEEDVQEVIDYAVELGYIKESFPAADIMDTRFLQ
jgi:NitT/TauT family transport system substrate-binding protein